MLPICTWTVRIGQVLKLGVDMMNLLLSFCSAFLLRVRSKGHKSLGSATRKMSLNYALDILM